MKRKFNKAAIQKILKKKDTTLELQRPDAQPGSIQETQNQDNQSAPYEQKGKWFKDPKVWMSAIRTVVVIYRAVRGDSDHFLPPLGDGVE